MMKEWTSQWLRWTARARHEEKEALECSAKAQFAQGSNSSRRSLRTVRCSRSDLTSDRPFLAADHCADDYLSLQTFFMQGMSGISDLSSRKLGHTTGESGRHGTLRTVRRGVAGHNKVATFPFSQKPTVPLALPVSVNNCSERFRASMNKGNPM